ncbi:MAG: MFS transporter [Parachlamydiaceae bacterium]
MQQKELPRRFLYFLAAVSSLSSAGAGMTLIALSSSFFVESPEGLASSAIQLMYYLGIGCIGFFGGGILQKWTPVALGIFGPLTSSLIVFYLATFDVIPFFIGFPAIFLIFLLNGIDHPNNLRFFNEVIPERHKLSFFSFTESSTAFFQIIPPILASIIIASLSVKACFIIDGCTYLASILPWLMIKKKLKKPMDDLPDEKVNYFLGFQILYRNPQVRALTISRLLNNLAYVTCTTAIPLVIAKVANEDSGFFTFQLAITNAIISTGFIGAGVLGAVNAKTNGHLILLIYSASLLAFGACLLLMASILFLPLLYLSALFLGIGTYCFRLSGMTLGQAFTPPSALGPVIIAGDTVVRGWSFLVSMSTLFVFEFQNLWGISFGT